MARFKTFTAMLLAASALLTAAALAQGSGRWTTGTPMPSARTEIAVADQVAAAADLARDKGSGEPACLVRGLGRLVTGEDGPGAAALRRRPAEDLFR